jgi:hypothetical protein
MNSLGLPSELPAGAAGGNYVSGFVMQQQEQTQWCWAAVSASVAALHQQSLRQCAIVKLTRGVSTCCESGGSISCNQPWYLDQALQKTGNLAQFFSQYLPWSQLMVEIDAGRPVGVRMQWSNGGGHFIAVSGYNAVTGIIDVRDPWFGDSSVNYSTFISSYLGRGRWTDSYLTTPASSQQTSPLPQPGSAPTPGDPWNPQSDNPGTTPAPTGPAGPAAPAPPAPFDPWQPRP